MTHFLRLNLNKPVKWLMAFATFFILGQENVFAADYYWVGSNNTNWSVPGNWRTGSFGGTVATSRPVAGDNVFFTAGGTNCNFNIGTVNVANVTIDAGYTGTILQNTANFSVDSLIMAGGNFVGSGDNTINITIRGNFKQTGGNFTSTKGQLIFTASNTNHTFGGTFIHNSNLLTDFRGTTTINGNPTFYKLQFTSKSKRIYTISNTIQVENNFTLADTGSIYINGGTIELLNTANLNCLNTATSGGGNALINFTGTGNQNLYGASNPGESRLPRIQINKTSGTVFLHNKVNITNEFTNASNSVDATSNFSKVIFTNGTTGLPGGGINQYDIVGNTTFHDLEMAPTTNTVFNIPSGTTLTVANEFGFAGTNRLTINTGIVDVKGNMVVTNTSSSGGVSTGIIRFTSNSDQSFTGSTTDGIGQLPKIEVIKSSGTLFMHEVINLKGGLVVSGNSQVNDSDAIIAINGSMTIESISNQLTLNHLLIPGNAGTNLTSNVTNSLQVNKLEMKGTENIVLSTSLIGSQNLFVKVSGDLINTNTSTANGGGSASIMFNGSGDQNLTGSSVIGGGKLPSIFIDKSVGNLILNETINLANNADLTLNNGTVIADGSTLVIANNGTDITGIHTLNNLIFAPSTVATHNYAIDPANTLALTGDLIFDGPAGSNITLTSGTIDVKKNLTINNGSLTSNGSGLISMTGTADQYIISNAPAGIPNLTVNKTSGILSVGSDINVRSTLAMTKGDIDMNGNTLTLGTSASLANRGTLDYAAGKVYDGTFSRWYGTTAVSAGSNESLFPVGTQTNDRRMYISTTSAPTTGGTIAVKHDPNAAAASTDMMDGTDQVLSFLPSGWDINSNVTGGTYNLRMSAEGLGPINKLSDIRIVKNNAVVGTYSATNGTTENAILNRTGISQTNLAGTYRIGSKEPINPLPVALVSFNAEKASNAVNLNWKTASEKNNDLFVVERSADGRNFEAIGQVKGASNSNVLNAYAFADKNPVNGVSYYRLKQIDFDGKFEYSKIVSVTFEGKITAVAINAFPNPANNLLNVKVNGLNGKATMEITDVTGRSLKQLKINAAETNAVNVEMLPKGLYQIRIVSENGSAVSKFLKQ
ncbi:T9SS type A sorting domain-containing protein [Adhaeribacter terreus]|uniref:T9SS type A sorting domain-containing protein n=1 Tax=Adhaeribacter terreus TaxID=529703 RepID=A0ABW0ECI9_9BACT